MFPRKATTQELEDIIVVSLTSTHFDFVTKVVRELGQKLNPERDVMQASKFSGGEFDPKFINEKEETVDISGKNVYLVGSQSPFNSPQEINFRALMAAFNANKLGAKEVIYVSNELSYTRSDRDEPGRSAQSENFANELSMAGVSSVITYHLHNPRIKKFYRNISKKAKKINDLFSKGIINFESPFKEIKVNNILPHNLYAHYIKNYSGLDLSNEGNKIVIVEPDFGAKYIGDLFYKSLDLNNSSLLRLSKIREEANNKHKLKIKNHSFVYGDSLEGKDVIWLDDSIDTGGTNEKFFNWILDDNNHGYGVPNSITLIFTHSILGGKSWELSQKRISEFDKLREIVTTDSRPYIIDQRISQFSKFATVLTTEKLLAEAILCHYKGENFIAEFNSINPKNLSQFGFLYKPSRYENNHLGKLIIH